MKKNLIFFTLVLLFVSCKSYTVVPVKSTPSKSVEGGVLYALPRTEILVDVTFRYIDTSSAPFVDYAEEMIAVKPTMDYSIVSVAIDSRVVADPNHYYFVHPRKLSLQVDANNLLRSVGLSAAEAVQVNAQNTTPHNLKSNLSNSTISPQPSNNLYDRIDTFYSRNDRPGHPSLMASKKDSRSLRQRAQAAAERLGELQERRQELLDGDYETSYAPETVRLMLQLIEQQEQQLVGQFLGSERLETVRYVVDPKDEKAFIDNQTVTLFYFSPDQGIADSTDNGAEAVRCNIRCVNNLRNAARFVRYRSGGTSNDKNPNERNTLKYRRSEQADVSVFCSQFRYDEQLPVAQFGPIIELPNSKIQALFSPATGDLIYLSK